MAKISKTVVDADLRARIFKDIFGSDETPNPVYYESEFPYYKINDRQFGTIITDKNGVERYCRVGVIVAEEREDMTACELMAKEQKDYQDKQAEKAEKAKKNAEKVAKDKAARAKKKEEEDDPNQFLAREVRE